MNLKDTYFSLVMRKNKGEIGSSTVVFERRKYVTTTNRTKKKNNADIE